MSIFDRRVGAITVLQDFPSAKSHRTVSISTSAAASLGRGASVLLLMMLGACAAPPVLPPVNSSLPQSLQAPTGDMLDDVLISGGDIVYQCDRNPAELDWIYLGAESTLFNSSGENVGTVLPGGYFTADDESYVKTQIDAQEVVSQENLPWARFGARLTAGSPTSAGRFARTALIQRVNTIGGLPPTRTCEPDGSMIYVPYSATYMIYRPSADSAAADTLSPGELAVKPGNAALPGR